MSSLKRAATTPRGKHSNMAHARAHLRSVRALLICLIAALGLLGAASLARAAGGLTATKTYTFISGDGDGKADPGETIEYTVQINANAFDATSVAFNDTIDANTTLVSDSVNVSPIAFGDSYDTIGNTLLEVGVTAGAAPAVRVAGSLLGNDRDFLAEAGSLTISAHTSPAHGSLAAFNSSTGTFSYLPAAGYTGADSFSYTLTDAGGLSDTATVTININAARVWYVSNSAAAGGQGRSTDPFDTLAQAQTASAASDTIYLFQGDGTTTGQNAGIALKDGQRLLGEGVALTVPVSVNGGANPLTLRAAGSQPRLDNTAGNGVAVASGVPAEIRGLSISGSANAIDITTSGTSAGTLTIQDNTIFSAGAEGIDINQSSTGTLTLNLQNTSWSASGPHTGNALDARTTAGALRLSLSDNIGIRSSATGVLLDGAGGGSLTVTSFSNTSIHQSTVGGGVSATSVIFDATPGGAFQTVAGGTTTIGVAGDGVGGSGMLLTNVSGDLSFTDLDIVADGGRGLSASGTTPYTGSAGFQFAVGSGVATISAAGGAAVDLSSLTVALPLASITSTNSSGAGVSLATVLGTFSAGSGSAISNANGIDFSVSTSNATITYSGSISDSAGAGVALTSNTGSTITFNGGMALSSGSSTAFTATGGGTVKVCDEIACDSAATGALVNTLSSTTGVALNIANTTIGSSNLEFKSISANGAPNGIVLNTTGSSGGLVVKGDSGSSNNSSGGTISNTTGDGIALTNTQNVAFDQLTIQAPGGNGVSGTGVTNFAFTNSTITDAGDAGAESAIAFNGSGALTGNNIAGTLTITGNTLTNAYFSGIDLQSDSGTVSTATIASNTIGNPGSAGINIVGIGNASGSFNLTKATINQNTVSSSGGLGIQVNVGNSSGSGPGATAGSGGANLVSITNNAITLDASGTNAIVVANSGGNPSSRSKTNFTIQCNGVNTGGCTSPNNVGIGSSSSGTVILLGNNGFSDMTGTVDANKIVASHTADGGGGNGIGGGNGVTTNSQDTPDLTLTVTNNTISGIDGNGILLVGRGSSGTAEFGVRNNTVAAPLSGVRPGIRVDAGNTSSLDDAVCLDISGNTSAGSGDSQGIGLRKQGTLATTNDFGIVGMSATSSPGIETYVAGLNSAGGGALLISATSGFSSCSTSALAPDSGPALARQPASVAPLSAAIGSTGFQPAAYLSSADQGPLTLTQTSDTWQTGGGAARVADSAHSAPALQPAPAPAAAGETLNLAIGTLPVGKRVIITYRVTVNDPVALGASQITNQGTISGSNFATVRTDDPAVAGSSNPTTIAIDRPDTTVAALERAGASPSNSASVTWRVTFVDAVDGLTASSFSLMNSGLGGSPAITSVAAVGTAPATSWDVTASTGSGQGTLGLNLTSDSGLSHDLTNAPFTGQVYTLDLIAPTVLSVTSSTADGYYNAGDTIDIQVVFSEPVTLTGSLQLTLETGAADALVDYASGSGTDTLTFSYTVVAGQSASDLDYASASALALASGSLEDAATNGANLALAAPGAAGSLGASKALVIDTAAPVAPVAASPANGSSTSDSTPATSGTAELSSTVTIYLDGSAAGTTTADASGNWSFTPSTALADGAHTLKARASDAAGNSSADSNTNTFTVDTATPAAPVVTSPANGSSISDSTPAASGTAELSSTVTIYLDGSAAGTATADASGDWSFTPSTALADGSHSLKARARDAAGNSSADSNSSTFTVDTAAPDTTITAAPGDPSNSASASFSFSGSDGSGTGVASFACQLDSGGFTACASPQAYTDLADGSHTFEVRATDGVDNTDATPASFSWTVDTAAPATTITAKPASLTNSSSASFSFTGDDGSGTGVASFACQLDSGGFTACSSPQSYTGLADGSHTFEVRATDSAGNADATPASYSWTIDTTVPVAPVAASPANGSSISDSTPATGGTAEPDSTVTIYLDGSAAGTTTADASGNWSFTPGTALADGSHTLRARARDAAGNSSVDSNTNTFTVDTAAPDTTITASPASQTNSASASFSFSGSDGSGTGVASFACQLDSGGFAACTSAQSYTGLADGSHTFEVRATDNVDNTDATPAAFSWTIDTSAPTATMSSASADPINSSPITVTVQFSEPITGFEALDISPVVNGSVSNFAAVDSDTYTFELTPAGQGLVSAMIATGSYSDTLNSNTAVSSFSRTYDSIAPSVTVEQAAGQADPAGVAPIEFAVVFSEPVASFSDANLSLGGSAPGSLSAIVSGGPITYTVAVSGMTGNGTLTAAVAAGAVSDAAGNANSASTSSDNQVSFDTVVPVVTGVVRADASPTLAATLAFTVTFSKDVIGVDASDFALAASGLTGTAVTGVTGGGSTWRVSASTGAGDGTLRLDLLDDGTIADAAGNALAGKGLGNGDFSAGEVYTIDRSAPQASSLSAADITSAGGTSQSFTVAYSDNLALDLASLDSGDIRVSGPNSFSQLAALVSVAPATIRAPLLATYQIAAPGGSWDAADVGAYRVELLAGQVRDTVGNTAAARALGGFSVSTAPPIRMLYLPMVGRPGTPDLVTSISISPNKLRFAAGEPAVISVTVTNQGDGAADAFWVDLYINPASPPTAANQIWNTRCALTPCFGIAWQVPAGLAPGQSITLTSQNLPFGYSVWPGWFAAGTSDLYAYADSFNPGMAAGAVAERDETNNRAELHGLSVTGTNPRLAARPASRLR